MVDEHAAPQDVGAGQCKHSGELQGHRVHGRSWNRSSTPPDGESWAHGISERAVGQIKETASFIQQSLPEQDPVLSLAMATSAMNNTEFVKGYTSIQWAFGTQAELDDGELLMITINKKSCFPAFL